MQGLFAAKLMASGTAGLTAMCLLMAVVHVGRLPATRTEAIDLGYQYVDPQSQMGVQEEAVPLPQFGELGTNHAFLNKGDGDGQSTKDMALFQQLAVKQAKKGKKAHGPWKPLAANKLFNFKGVHFKGFNHKKAAMLHKMKMQAKLQMKHTRMGANRPKQLWPSSVIAGSGPQAPRQQSARPLWNSDMSPGPMGTNNVFLGSHQGGDSTFSHQQQPQAAPRPRMSGFQNGNAHQGPAPMPGVSPYMSITHKALPNMLAFKQQKQLWPSSVIGQQPIKGQDHRVHPWTSGADGSIIPGR